ncbi:hypothetical protein ACLOJK_037479 [Asimina triloba]
MSSSSLIRQHLQNPSRSIETRQVDLILAGSNLFIRAAMTELCSIFFIAAPSNQQLVTPCRSATLANPAAQFVGKIPPNWAVFDHSQHRNRSSIVTSSGQL